MRTKIILLIVAVSLMAGSAMAAIVGDGSFEQMDATGTGTYWVYPDGVSTPWEYNGTDAAIVDGPAFHVAYPSLYPLAGSDGDQYMGGWNGNMYQYVDLVAGQEYQVSLMGAANGASEQVKVYIPGAIDPSTGVLWVDNWGWGGGWMPGQLVNYTGVAGVSPDDWELHTWNFIAATTGSQIFYVQGTIQGYIDDVAITEAWVPTSAPATDDILIQPTTGPTGTLRNDFTGSMGLRFRVDREVPISKLAFYDHGSDGLAVNHTMRIYESNDDGATGAVIAEATVPAGTDAVLSDGFRWVGLASPVLLSPQTGTDWYVLTATIANGDGDSWYHRGVTGIAYNSYMDTASGWQTHWGSNPDSIPTGNAGGANATFYMYNMAEGHICLDPPQSDFNGDCIVDTADLAAFIAKWLD